MVPVLTLPTSDMSATLTLIVEDMTLLKSEAFIHPSNERFSKHLVSRYYRFSSETRSCYVVNAQDLLNAVSEQDSSSSKMSGLMVGCAVDVASGHLTFTANGKEIDYFSIVEPDTLLYPAVFVSPTCKEAFQFELGRVKVSFCNTFDFEIN